MNLSRLGLFLLVCAALATASGVDTAVAGRPAPMFRSAAVNRAADEMIVLEDHFRPDSSHAVIVAFFATWCLPCRKELPLLQQAADSLASEGLRLVAVNADSVYGPKQQKMVAELGLRCPVAHDRFGILRRHFGCSDALPCTAFIDRRGILREFRTGFAPGEEAAVTRAIGEILAR